MTKKQRFKWGKFEFWIKISSFSELKNELKKLISLISDEKFFNFFLARGLIPQKNYAVQEIVEEQCFARI